MSVMVSSNKSHTAGDRDPTGGKFLGDSGIIVTDTYPEDEPPAGNMVQIGDLIR
jgi:hypothetical protein